MMKDCMKYKTKLKFLSVGTNTRKCKRHAIGGVSGHYCKFIGALGESGRSQF